MSSDFETEKSNIFGTLCDVNQAEDSMTISQTKDLVCAIVDEIATGARREVHAKLHAAYKKFAKSTPVEGKLTDNNKLEIFNQIRTKVSATIQDIMESLSFGSVEASAVAKLISAGTASEKVGYTKAPSGVNMSNLLSSAKEALTDRQTEPKERTVNTNHRTSTEFWSAEQPRRQAVHRQVAETFESPRSNHNLDFEDEMEDREDCFRAEAKSLAPEAWFDEDEISQKERRKSLEAVSKLQVPGGPFTGTDDRRSVRKILRWIKQESEDKCLTPLESYFLIRASFRDRLIKGLERAKMQNQREVRRVLLKNISQLLAMFAPTLQHERNRARKAQLLFRPKFKESLQEAIVRYDEVIEEAEDFDINLTEADKISVFIDSLGEEDRILAVTVQENCRKGSFEQFKRKLITYSQNKTHKRFDSSRNQPEAPKIDPGKTESRDTNKPPRQNDNKSSFQRKWQPKKNEANVAEEGSEDGQNDSGEDSSSSSDAELNLVEIGIAPEGRDYLRLPTANKNGNHYSTKGCVELNHVQLDNSGPKAAILRVRINERDIDVLVDSGATRSLVDVEFMRTISQGQIIPGARLVDIPPISITYAIKRIRNTRRNSFPGTTIKRENHNSPTVLRFPTSEHSFPECFIYHAERITSRLVTPFPTERRRRDSSARPGESILPHPHRCNC
jgi:hypothetical protein